MAKTFANDIIIFSIRTQHIAMPIKLDNTIYNVVTWFQYTPQYMHLNMCNVTQFGIIIITFYTKQNHTILYLNTGRLMFHSDNNQIASVF